jgi:hypothetical protein
MISQFPGPTFFRSFSYSNHIRKLQSIPTKSVTTSSYELGPKNQTTAKMNCLFQTSIGSAWMADRKRGDSTGMQHKAIMIKNGVRKHPIRQDAFSPKDPRATRTKHPSNPKPQTARKDKTNSDACVFVGSDLCGAHFAFAFRKTRHAKHQALDRKVLRDQLNDCERACWRG